MGLDLTQIKHKKTEVELAGKKYMFTEVNLGDIGAFRGRVKENREKTREARRDRLLIDAKAIGEVDPMKLLETLDRPPTEEEYDAAADTLEGIAYLAFLSLQHECPRCTEDNIKTLITVRDVPAVVEAMGLGDEDDDADKKKPRTLKEKRSRGALPSRKSSNTTKGRSSGKTSRK